jgi:hypothetical protein
MATTIVIKIPDSKKEPYQILFKQSGCYMASGYSFKTKKESINFARDCIFNTIHAYNETIILWEDTAEAWEKGEDKKELTLTKPRHKT